MPRDDFDIARFYHLNSANVRSKAVDLSVDYDNRPARSRRIPGAPVVALPKGHFRIDQRLGTAFETRRSVRDFVLKPLPLDRLSQILFLSYGVRGLKTIEGELTVDRCAPSAGGLYPIELYAVTERVNGLRDGIYHYDARFHKLEQVRLGRFHETLAELTIGQDMIRAVNVVIVMTGTFTRTMWKYGIRGYRYVWLDAGHVGQNIYLAAGGLGLGAVTIGGFFDEELNRLLQLEGDETAVYLACVGQPRPEPRRARSSRAPTPRA